jgi:integrase
MNKRRGQGWIFRKPGTDRWTIQYYVNGKRVRESAGTANRNATVAILNQRLAAIGQGRTVGPAVEKTTLGQLISMVEADYRANGRKTLNRVQAAVVHLRDFFGADSRARSITADRVTAYAARRLDGGAKPSTINYEMATLRRGFRLGLDTGRAMVQPKISMLRTNNVRKGFFEKEQFEGVLRHLPDHLKPMVRVAYLTGWRKQELLSRQWRHVDLKYGWLRLEPGETKNGEGREFPFTAELRAILLAQHECVRELESASSQVVPWVFYLPDGRRIGDFRKAWAKACRLAGVPGRLLHDFRRTAVRNLERAGVARSAAMRRTGHLTESIYQRYAITDSTMLQEAAAKLDAFYAAQGVRVDSPNSAPISTIALPERRS